MVAGPAVPASSTSSHDQVRATPLFLLPFPAASWKAAALLFLTSGVTSSAPGLCFLRTFHGYCSFGFPFI